MEKPGYIYILTSRRNGTLYTGVTSDLVARIWQHRNGTADGFTKQYGVTTLVHFEIFANIEDAIRREKAIKKWYRKWKLELIERDNPNWHDLWPDITGFPLSRE
ncbi:MAG: GIY-YIG nuclease family protein [Rhodospirillales bacterium]|nr:GIY-YIG nuclease family protein [Rhodospirillales bacterium]MBO6787217.1 GIY-YIG nuclease family protein [Rhodospirillales bacterium]